MKSLNKRSRRWKLNVRSAWDHLFDTRWPFKNIRQAWRGLTGKHYYDEYFSLDWTIAKILAPRLRHFQQTHVGHPNDMTEEVWADILDRMATAFELMCDDEILIWPDDEEYQKIDDGLYLFYKYYRHLWL